MAAKAPHVTVEEYINQFYVKFLRHGYAQAAAANAEAGAEALLAMLKLVWQKGGKDDMKAAFHCFKDQLTAANSCAPDERIAVLNDLFLLLSALVNAAEKLRQFSPVKETLSHAILLEVRGRLYRIVAGDSFAGNVDIRRKALDICFQQMMTEQAVQQRTAKRKSQLKTLMQEVKGASSTLKAKAANLQLKVAAGPDTSSWEALWNSLGSMAGNRMLPLLQSVMIDMATYQAINNSSGSSSFGGRNRCGSGRGVQQQQQQQNQQAEDTQQQEQQQEAAGADHGAARQGRSESSGSITRTAAAAGVGDGVDEEDAGPSGAAGLRSSDNGDGWSPKRGAAAAAAAAAAVDVGGSATSSSLAAGKCRDTERVMAVAVSAMAGYGLRPSQDDVVLGKADDDGGSLEASFSEGPAEWVQFTSGCASAAGSRPNGTSTSSPQQVKRVAVPVSSTSYSIPTAAAAACSSSGGDGHSGGLASSYFSEQEAVGSWGCPLDSPVSWEAEFPTDALAAVADLQHELRAAGGRAGEPALLGPQVRGSKQQQLQMLQPGHARVGA